jgi:hypothetical protein
VDAAVGVEHRIRGIGTEPAGADLVRFPLQRNLLAEISAARNQLLGAIDLTERVHKTLVKLAIRFEIVFRVVQDDTVAVEPDAIVWLGRDYA